MKRPDTNVLSAQEQALLDELLTAGRKELPTDAQLQRVWSKAQPWGAHKPPLFLLDNDGLPLPTRSCRPLPVHVVPDDQSTVVPLPQDAVEASQPAGPPAQARAATWGSAWISGIAAGVVVLLSLARPASQDSPSGEVPDNLVRPLGELGVATMPSGGVSRALPSRSALSALGTPGSSAASAVAVSLRDRVATREPDAPGPSASAMAASESLPEKTVRVPIAPPLARAPQSATAERPAKAARTAVPAKTESAVELLKTAQDRLRTDPGASLALLSEYERRFGSDALTQEREVLTIDAMLRLGQRDRARARATEFFARFPDSSHVRRINVMLQRP